MNRPVLAPEKVSQSALTFISGYHQDVVTEVANAVANNKVVVVGMSTSIGVESTARHARELGYSVTLVTDAMTDTNLEAHNNSIEIIFPRLGETCTTSELTALLEK